MSLRKLIELERDLYGDGLRVALKMQPDGIFIEGPDLADRLVAASELRKRKIVVAGHAFKLIDMGAVGLSAI